MCTTCGCNILYLTATWFYNGLEDSEIFFKWLRTLAGTDRDLNQHGGILVAAFDNCGLTFIDLSNDAYYKLSLSWIAVNGLEAFVFMLICNPTDASLYKPTVTEINCCLTFYIDKFKNLSETNKWSFNAENNQILGDLIYPEMDREQTTS